MSRSWIRSCLLCPKGGGLNDAGVGEVGGDRGDVDGDVLGAPVDDDHDPLGVLLELAHEGEDLAVVVREEGLAEVEGFLGRDDLQLIQVVFCSVM